MPIKLKKLLPRLSWLAIAVVPILPTTATAQASTGATTKTGSIAGEIAALTAKLNNPDPSVQLNAYNSAFSNPNPIIREIALRSAANSTSQEIRSIALMGAFSHIKSLVLSFTVPKGSQEAGAKKIYNMTGGMVTLQIVKFDSSSGNFTFVTDDQQKSLNINQKNFSQGTVVGERVQMNVSWFMSFDNNTYSCPTVLKLKSGKLAGTMTCTGGSYTMIRAPVTANLF